MSTGWTFFFAQEPEEAFVNSVNARTVLIALVATLASLALATDYPVTVVDDLGRDVTLQQAPQRVVAMIPSHTETVCALAGCGVLVGVDQFSNFPAEVSELPQLGSGFNPNVEALVALDPDLVLVDEYSGLAEALEPFDIPVFAGTPQTLEETYALFETFGTLLAAEDVAALLVGRVRGQLAGVATRVAGVSEPEIYFEIDATPYSVGPGSFIGQLIAAAGGANIVPAELGDFPQLDPEYVVAANPEVILLADAPYGESLATLRARPGWASIEAVASGRVIEMTQAQVDIVNRAGPRLGEAVVLLARWLHPGRF